MHYMARHGTIRARPAELVPGTLRVITARMNYLPLAARDSDAVLADPDKAFIARYALGRDYHKVLRAQLQRLADRIGGEVGAFGYRVFTDSAPVLEVALAANAGIGWRGKRANTARGFSWASSIPTCRCPSRRRNRRIAAAVPSASTSARRARSSHRTNSMPAAASRT
jgi:hypothetical protein